MDDINLNFFEEQSFFTTVLIENLTDGEAGTGFIVSKEKDGKHKLLLFSNKHVFLGMKNWQSEKVTEREIEITLHRKQDNKSYELGDTTKFSFKLEKDKSGYFEHKDQNVDVACVNISSLFAEDEAIKMSTLKIEDFYKFNFKDIPCGQRIIFVGYPNGLYDRTNYLPIMRTGFIASIPSINFNGKRQLLIDAHVFPGSSGSPVFVQINNEYQLIGILSQSFMKSLDYIEIAEKRIPQEFIGLGILFKTDTIKEVLDLI